MDFESYILSSGYVDDKIIEVNQTINQITSGIKSITANGSMLTFTLSDNSQISVTLTGLSDNNYTTIDKNKLQSIDADLINKFSYDGTQLLFDGQPIQGNSIDLSNYYNKDEAKAQFNVKPINYLYVGKNGSDTTGDGSANRPYLTVQKAIDMATNGTTIFIFPATYTENITFKAGVYLTASVKYGVYITGNHIVDYTGTTICENIVLNSSSGITLSFQGTNAQSFQLLGCSVDSNNGHAINWTNTNASSKIYSEDSITNVSNSGVNAKAFYSSSTAKGYFIANRYSFKVNNPDNICLDINGAINFTHTGDQIIGQVLVSNSATVTIGSMVMTTLTTPVLTTNSTGMTTIASTIVNTTSSPIITGVGAFSYVAILYGNTGVGGASSLNGGLGAIALPMSSIKLRNASLIPNGAVALGYTSGSFEYDGNNLYFTKGTTRDKVAMMGDIPNVSNKLEVENIIAGNNISLDVEGKNVTINSITSGGFLNVKGLGMTIADGGNEAIISFTNPASDNIDKIYLYVSYLEDLSNQSYEYVSANATLLSNNFIITSGAINTFNLPINDNNLNKNAYVKVFVGYGGTDYSSGSSINQVLADVTPTSPVTNITVTQLAKDSVKLTWSNPSESDLKSVNVVMKYDTSLNSIYDGTSVYTGNGNTCNVVGLSVGKHVYFRIYTLDISNNIQSDQSQIISIQLDNTSPSEATNFSLLSGFSLCKLKFGDSISTDWKISKVVRKVGSEPTSIDDGTLILTNMTRDAYKNNYFIDGGLSNGTSYYYKVYSIDNFGNISDGISQVGNPVATSLPEVTNFKIENIQNGTKQKISWTNPFAPSGLTYVEHQLFYTKDQTVSFDTMTRDQCIASGLISSLNLGAGTGQGVNDSFTTSTALTIGDISRYKIFVHFDSSGTAVWSSGTYDIKEVKDETPLTDITGLVTTAGDTQTTIQWINPNTSSDSDFAKVQIYRKIGAYPDGMNDLEKVYESTNKNAGNLNTFLDSNLVNNTIYYYLIKLTDISGNININTKFTLTPVPLPIYSISYNSLTKTWTRGNLASSMSASDFNSISPYKDIKRVLLTDAKVKTYLKSTDSTLKEDGTSATLDGTQGNVFSEIPKFYYKYNYDGTSIHTWTIANSAIGGCTLHPAFIRNSVNKDYLYIGSYKGYVNGTKLESRSGIIPTINGKSFSDFITLAEARGTGFTQFDSLSLHVLQLLFIMQYGTPDTSTILGGGQDLGNILTTGGTNSLGNATGKVGNYSSLYGVENIFGEAHNVISGLIAGSKYFQANNSFSSMTSEVSTGTYTQLSSTTPSTTNGFIGDIEPISSAFIGKTMDASSTTGFCDYQLSKNGSNLNILLMGGSTLSDQRGLFNNEFVDVSVMSSTNNMTQGSLIESTYTEWTLSVDKTAYGIKSISSFSLVDGATPSIVTNLSINNLSGRLIAY